MVAPSPNGKGSVIPGGTVPKIQHLAHVAFWTTRLEEMIEFYLQILDGYVTHLKPNETAFISIKGDSEAFSRHSPDDIRLRGKCTTIRPPRELHPLCSHPMA